jgi:hypothetical protein
MKISFPNSCHLSPLRHSFWISPLRAISIPIRRRKRLRQTLPSSRAALLRPLVLRSAAIFNRIWAGLALRS